MQSAAWSVTAKTAISYLPNDLRAMYRKVSHQRVQKCIVNSTARDVNVASNKSMSCGGVLCH